MKSIIIVLFFAALVAAQPRMGLYSVFNTLTCEAESQIGFAFIEISDMDVAADCTTQENGLAYTLQVDATRPSEVNPTWAYFEESSSSGQTCADSTYEVWAGLIGTCITWVNNEAPYAFKIKSCDASLLVYDTAVSFDCSGSYEYDWSTVACEEDAQYNTAGRGYCPAEAAPVAPPTSAAPTAGPSAGPTSQTPSKAPGTTPSSKSSASALTLGAASLIGALALF